MPNVGNWAKHLEFRSGVRIQMEVFIIWNGVVVILPQMRPYFVWYHYCYVISMPQYICVLIFEHLWNIIYRSFDARCLLDHVACQILIQGRIRMNVSSTLERCFSNCATCRDNVIYKNICMYGHIYGKACITCFLLNAMEPLPCWITQCLVQFTESRVIASSRAKWMAYTKFRNVIV